MILRDLTTLWTEKGIDVRPEIRFELERLSADSARNAGNIPLAERIENNARINLRRGLY